VLAQLLLACRQLCVLYTAVTSETPTTCSPVSETGRGCCCYATHAVSSQLHFSLKSQALLDMLQRWVGEAGSAKGKLQEHMKQVGHAAVKVGQMCTVQDMLYCWCRQSALCLHVYSECCRQAAPENSSCGLPDRSAPLLASRPL
jgi:hypothetical protein